MNDLKHIVAENIINLRTACQMTQFELGEKINYSDKAVSRWERAEAIPDARVLLQLSEIFGVTVDYILHKHTELPLIHKPVHIEHKNIIFVTITGVWTIALLIFVVMYLCGQLQGMMFVYALPVSLIVYLVLNSVWCQRKNNIYIISALIWSAIASVYLSALFFASLNWWIIFVLGIPAQIILLLGFRIKKKP